MTDVQTFKQPCGMFFRAIFGEIIGYEEHPEINGKHPDFSITPSGRKIFFEIYRPEKSKLKELKDKNDWKETIRGSLRFKRKYMNLSIYHIKSDICMYIKEKKRKNQLPKDKPNLLVLDLSNLPEESVFIDDIISLIDSDIYEIFAIMPSLSGLVFYMKNIHNKVRLLFNPTAPATINGLTKEERELIKNKIKYELNSRDF